MKIDVSYSGRNESYSLIIQRGLLGKAGAYITRISKTSNVIVLTNNTVKKLWADSLEKSFTNVGLNYRIISIPDGENYKSLDMYNRIIAKMLKAKYDRNAILVTFGGGVIGDLGGFIAATFKRGIKLIHIPTSLVAQVDASIGGKVAVDLPLGKNLIGAFYNPCLILTDPEILATLDTRQYINGLFEIIKIALVNDPDLLTYINKNYKNIMERKLNYVNKMVYFAASNKVQIISKDPYEAGLRIILNYGHTLGHALETAGEYKDIMHGEAVGYGMLLATHLASQLNISGLDENSLPYRMISKLLNKGTLQNISASSLWSIICNDKKAKNNRVRFVQLEDLGIPRVVSVTKPQFAKAWKRLCMTVSKSS